MVRRLLLLVAIGLVDGGLTSPARLFAQQGPLAPEEALKALKVPDGFQVELFAAEPMLINPTSIDVDHKGRVWVAEAVNYRRKPPYNRPIIRKEGDRIVVLVDEQGQGKATKAVTFYQGEDIYGPLCVTVAPYPDGKGQKVFVCQSPDILVFEDKDGDLKADGPPKKFLAGFGGIDHDHGVHGLNIGPDGKLYFTVGDGGVTGLQSSDGKGRKWVSNGTDCRAGTVWRCDFDGTNLELIAHNFRNNYECCVDSFGEIWLSDNDDDGNQQTRICFVMPGGNYGYHPRGPGQTHWHEEQPGVVHKTLRTGQGSPTGITFYEGSLFPSKYRGAILHCDCAPSEVRWFFRKPKGAGYELDKELLLTSSDNWFRPSDVCVAPDGSIFVADWYDRGVGGHGMGDPTDGRIYRITPKGHKGYTVPEPNVQTNDGVAATFASPCLATRHLGRAAVLESFGNDNPTRPVYATVHSVLNTQFNQPDVVARKLRVAFDAIPGLQLTGKDEFFARPEGAANIRMLSDTRGIVSDDIWKLIAAANFTSWPTSARRELLLELRTERPAVITKVFYDLAKFYDGQDHFYRAALNIACGTDPKRRDEILADFDKHFPEWNDKVADLVWELRPKSVLPRLGKLLADPKLTAVQKGRIVDIIAANDDLDAGRTMLDVLASDTPPEMKARAIESLKLFLPTKWKALQGSKELDGTIATLLKDKSTQVTGLQLVAAANSLREVEAVGKIAEDRTAPLDTRKEAVRALGKLKSVKAADSLDAVVTFDPDPALKLEAVRALGSQVTGQPKDEAGQRALAVLRAIVTAKDAPEPLKAATVEALAATRGGSQWLLDAHAKNELPKEVVAEAGRLLRNSAYQDLANRAKLGFPAPGKLNPKDLPAVAELARRSGDAARGKAVWNASLAGASQCAKCHMVRGVGGQVGPDLSMIGKKASRENLYESVLIPSKAIADQFVQHQLTTTAEVTITGLLVSDTPTSITLRDANGKDITTLKTDISGEVRKLKVSIMPEDVIAALSLDELIDLVAYLETLKTAALTPDSFDITGPFQAKSMEAALDTKHIPEPGGKFEKATWKTIRPDGKGYFDLAALHGNAANNSASYLYTEIESPVDQDAEVLLGTDDGAKLWVNGKEVFVSHETRAAAPEQNRVPVKLKKGTNTVVLKVANGSGPHGFYFSLTSADEVKVVPKR